MLYVQFCLTLLTLVAADYPRGPMVIVPGLMGSILHVRANDTSRVPQGCSIDENWRTIWVDALGILFNTPCWVYGMRLTASNDGYSYEPDSLEVRIPPDGIDATKCLDPNACDISIYLKDFYDHFASLGYRLGFDLDAVPYDWRISPLNHTAPQRLFDRLQRRIETMYADTNNTKVTVLGHSMGGAYSAIFLNQYVTQEWKDRYVARYISVAGVYAGAVKALKASICGENDGIFILPPGDLRPALSTFGGLASLVPGNAPDNSSNPQVWSDEFPLAYLDGVPYSVSTLPDLFNKSGYANISETLNTLRGGDMQSPVNVEVHCLYSSGIDTDLQLIISSNDPTNPSIVKGDGDGTVNSISLQVCSTWSGRQTQTVSTAMFTTSHMEIIKSDASAWDYIDSVVNNNRRRNGTPVITGGEKSK